MATEIEIRCSVCNHMLSPHDTFVNLSAVVMTVPPCDKCDDATASKGYDEGHEVGYNQGFDKAIASMLVSCRDVGNKTECLENENENGQGEKT